jgi:hypothetical protein
LPGYWQDEQSGILAPVVHRSLAGGMLDSLEIGVMRAYLRQWMAGEFRGPKVVALRRDVETIASTEDLDAWLERALEAGIDPL